MSGIEQQRSKGFTVIELLIIIVVVALLAGLLLAVYRGITDQSRDATRLQDAKTIVKALEVHKSFEGGRYPNEQSSSWETSVAYPKTFINALTTGKHASAVPVDPVNNNSYHYRYYLYSAGNGGCPVERGDFFVFQIIKPAAEKTPPPESPGFSCTGRNWNTEAWYTVGGYEN